jgi:hypothetical protein
MLVAYIATRTLKFDKEFFVLIEIDVKRIAYRIDLSAIARRENHAFSHSRAQQS